MRLEGLPYVIVMTFLALILGGSVAVIVYAWWAEITEWQKKYNAEEDADQ